MTYDPDADLTGFKVIGREIQKLGVIRNEVTLQLECGGIDLSEETLNGHFINLKNGHPEVRGLNEQAFYLYLKSDKVPSYNPIHDYLKGLPDRTGTAAIDDLFDSLKIKPIEILREPGWSAEQRTAMVLRPMFTKWLLGIVASAFDGNYNPLMVVLIGAKGCGKTEFFRRLLSKVLKRYFAQSKFNEGKDSEALMCEMILILNDELDGLTRKDARAFRNFISADFYNYRPPYGRKNITRKRLATVCGTANDRDVITESEHNRRIIPIEIDGVDHDKYNAVNKDDLFAELYTMYKNGGDWNLTSTEIMELTKISECHELVPYELEMLTLHFTPVDEHGDMPGEWLTTTEILNKLKIKDGCQQLNQIALGKALRRAGFTRSTKRRKKQVAYVYHVMEAGGTGGKFHVDENNGRAARNEGGDDLPF